MLRRVGEKGQVARTLEGNRQKTLMLGAIARLSARLYLAPVRYEPTQFAHVLVIN